MNSKSILILFALALLLCSLAFVRARQRRWQGDSSAGEALISDNTDASRICELRIEGSSSQMTLQLKEGAWRMLEANGASVHVDTLQIFVADLLQAKILRTISDGKLEDFGLTPQTGCISVKLLDSEGNPLAEAILGRRIMRQNPNAGDGVEDMISVGRYVLHNGMPAVVANPFLPADYTKEEWLAK